MGITAGFVIGADHQCSEMISSLEEGRGVPHPKCYWKCDSNFGDYSLSPKISGGDRVQVSSLFSSMITIFLSLIIIGENP